MSYYAQWKLTEDELGIDSQRFGVRSIGKHQVYGVGPELALPLATSKKLYGFLNGLYLWEFGAKSTLEGEALVVTLSFPIPSVPLQ